MTAYTNPELHGEITALRQAIWDAYGILGFDQDGDTNHRSHHPAAGWPDFLRQFATEARADHDEVLADLHAIELL